jgi:predicted DNA binding CopG/RHH family protein
MRNSQRKPKAKAEKPASRIPEFKNRQEEAEFWDTHSIADFWDELKPVKVTFAKNLSAGITIRLDQPTIQAVRAEARSKGIGPTTLIRMWVLERVNKGRPASARPKRAS